MQLLLYCKSAYYQSILVEAQLKLASLSQFFTQTKFFHFLISHLQSICFHCFSRYLHIIAIVFAELVFIKFKIGIFELCLIVCCYVAESNNKNIFNKLNVHMLQRVSVHIIFSSFEIE